MGILWIERVQGCKVEGLVRWRSRVLRIIPRHDPRMGTWLKTPQRGITSDQLLEVLEGFKGPQKVNFRSPKLMGVGDPSRVIVVSSRVIVPLRCPQGHGGNGRS